MTVISIERRSLTSDNTSKTPDVAYNSLRVVEPAEKENFAQICFTEKRLYFFDTF